MASSSTDYDYLLEYKEKVQTAVNAISANPSSAVAAEVSNILTDLSNAKMSGTDSISNSINGALAQCTSTFTAIQASINSTFKSIETQYSTLLTALNDLQAANTNLETVEANKPIMASNGGGQ